MKKFKIRTQGNDLKDIKFYNTWNEAIRSNPMFPEYAPKSVGGTGSGFKYKQSLGNCTWYARGRADEVWGEVIPKGHLSLNANLWLSTGFRKSDKPTVGSVVVFDDGKYGHVAFVEKIEGNKVILSESSYSERGNDFLFKYGRTVDEICKMWGMKILGYIPAPEPLESYLEEEVKLSNEEVARLVIKGVYGNDPHRTKKLKEEGYEPKVIQGLVNKINKPKEVVKPKPVEKPKSKVGQVMAIPKGTVLYDANGRRYALKTTKAQTIKITEDKGSLLGFSASWLIGTKVAYIKTK